MAVPRQRPQLVLAPSVALVVVPGKLHHLQHKRVGRGRHTGHWTDHTVSKPGVIRPVQREGRRPVGQLRKRQKGKHGWNIKAGRTSAEQRQVLQIRTKGF